MRMLAEFFPEFAEKLDEIDALYEEKRTIDEKTYQFICFALSIKGRSKPCVLKHFKGALEAGATVEELAYILALTMREAAGADDCWTHDVLGAWQDLRAGQPKASQLTNYKARLSQMNIKPKSENCINPSKLFLFRKIEAAGSRLQLPVCHLPKLPFG